MYAILIQFLRLTRTHDMRQIDTHAATVSFAFYFVFYFLWLKNHSFFSDQGTHLSTLNILSIMQKDSDFHSNATILLMYVFIITFAIWCDVSIYTAA